MAASDAAPGVTVLLVEDEPRNRALVRAVLSRAADERLRTANVLEAPDVASARAYLDSGRSIGIILLDVRLPDGNGLELAGEIRERPSPPPILVLSASVLPSERAAALRSGADDFMGKPFRAHDLYDAMARLLDSRVAGSSSPG
ncbi:MAG TPA: response regulator [Candidatus Polarisedimenticolia bacterium]|nr:response regulator [Candidatus Polarisedimenticolia bacterium]